MLDNILTTETFAIKLAKLNDRIIDNGAETSNLNAGSICHDCCLHFYLSGVSRAKIKGN